MQTYQIELKTLSNVHIGNGEKIAKYEYIYNHSNRTFQIINPKKMFEHLAGLNKAEDYISFVSQISSKNNNRASDLLKFLSQNTRNHMLIIRDCLLYEIDDYSRDVNFEDIDCFIKDKFTNKPYIPGSSIKGVLSTIILYELICKKYKGQEWIQKCFEDKDIKTTLKRIMKGISISDSELIDESCLCVNKIEYLKLSKDISKTLPQKYEMLKPDTTTYATITLDTTKMVPDNFVKDNQLSSEESDKLFNTFIQKFDINFLQDLINRYNKYYFDYYASQFNEGKRDNYVDFPKLENGTSKIYLGAKTGFPTKSIYYQYCPQKAGEEIFRILKPNFKTVKIDEKKRLSPTCLKTVRYGNELLDMGAVQISFKEIN